jgi:hypothetical protein
MGARARDGHHTSRRGYWLVASDGGIFSFGDARFHGSTGALHLSAPIVGMAPTPDGQGYTLVGADGGTHPFGTATFQGTFAGGLLGDPVVATAAVLAGKSAPPPPVTGTPVVKYSFGDFYYAGGSQTVSTLGASAQICQAEPHIGSSSDPDSVEHSLTEIAVQGAASGDIVELISMVIQPDPQPTLVVNWWRYGRNAGSAGYVQVSQTITNGMNLPVGSTGAYSIEQAGGRWDFYYDGQLMGYLSDSLWDGTFTQAATVQVFGEVQTYGAPPGGQMGNGQWGDHLGAAVVDGYQLLGSRETAAFDNLYATRTAPPYYAAAGINATSFRYGGPGA